MSNPTGKGGFKKGRSGNPTGRPKVPEEVRELARCYTQEAIETQVSVMRDAESPPAARVSAAENILNRAWGKPEGNLNLNMTAGQAFIELLRTVNERRSQEPAGSDDVPAAAVH